MTTPDARTEQLRALAFTALSRAIPPWRNLPVAERQDIADRVLAALREEIEGDGYQRGFTDGERHANAAELAQSEGCAEQLDKLPGQQQAAAFYRLHAEHMRALIKEKETT